MTDGSETLLAIDGAGKRFGETFALSEVSFTLHAGEVHCLVGENGAGKSTLIKILAGAENPDSGVIRIGGERYARLEPDVAIGLGIATIYQDVELISSLTVAENIFLGREIKRCGGLAIDFASQETAARALMDSLRIAIPERAIVSTLSTADRQTLQIVKALGRNARIMIMDEPTASLGYREAQALIGLIHDLRARGIGIIYVSHHLEEVFAVGDRITVLKDGRVVQTIEPDATTPHEVTNAMVGRESAALYRRRTAQRGPEVVRLERLTKRGVFTDCSFTVHAGEILGIGGMVGSGRSELVRAIYGDLNPDSGGVYLHGKPYAPSSPRDAIAHRIGYVGEDRHAHGLFPARSVLENMGVVRNENTMLLDHRAERQRARRTAKRMSLALSGLAQPAGSLSGGNQQKTIIGRWLLAAFDLLILDEPTKGVDVGAKARIYAILSQLVNAGKAIIMVSSDMPELIAMSDRIAVMRHGNVVHVMNSDRADEQRLVKRALGVDEDEEQDR